MEAVKQGSAVVGLRSDSHVVLATLKRATSELSDNQKKLFQVDDHCGIAIAGLTADARVLSRFMRNECLSHKYTMDTAMPINRLVLSVADKSQICTQRATKRPYGVGLLVAGYDSAGPHLFQTCPSGNYYEYFAMAIGARSQSAKTYLERSYEAFPHCTLDELCKHAILALRETVSSTKDTELTSKNTALAFVGKGQDFAIVEGDGISKYLDMALEEAPPASTDPAENGPQTGEEPPPAPMEQT